MTKTFVLIFPLLSAFSAHAASPAFTCDAFNQELHSQCYSAYGLNCPEGTFFKGRISVAGTGYEEYFGTRAKAREAALAACLASAHPGEHCQVYMCSEPAYGVSYMENETRVK